MSDNQTSSETHALAPKSPAAREWLTTRLGKFRGYTVHAAVPRSVAGQVAWGRVLLGVCGLVVAVTVWSLDPSRATATVIALDAILLLTVAVLAPRLPLGGRGSRWALVFPFVVLTCLLVVGVADPGVAVAYSGLITVCFVYVGLTQHPGTSVLLAPLAAVVWVSAQGDWTAVLGIRLAISVIIWLLVGELLSYQGDLAAADRRTLFQHATIDSLTGLVNRRALDERLAGARVGDTVIICDLDHFKVLNDREGHAAGDEVLAGFGALLVAGVRGADTAGRYGGEEFVLILADTTPEAALEVLARMRKRWRTLRPGVTFSSGVAGRAAGAPVSATLAAADEALYASKAAGRNCDHISYRTIVRAG